MPDLMADMLEQKIGSPEVWRQHRLGAVADGATLHALHYHQVDVAAIQQGMEKVNLAAERVRCSGLLTVPVAAQANW